MEELSKLLMQERKMLQEISQEENKRQELVEQTFQELNIVANEKTANELIMHMENLAEKQRLETAVTDLIQTIASLKKTEQLNQSLIQQSMQFVQLSLEMLQPETKNINYSKEQIKRDSVKQTVFDSKV